MTVPEMKDLIEKVLSPKERHQWLCDQAAGKRSPWEELAQIYTEKGL